ncbi:MAG: hypothetical protein OEQ90_04130 [Gammaproteobacteria bacterium]|nr:hypothetical protein [Gammaproteobacteria bacterium]
MNTFNLKDFSGVAIVLLLAIGVASTIATGGGSSGGSVSMIPPPTSDDPTLAISAANGEDVSSAVVLAIGISFDLGDITGDDLIAEAAGDTINLSAMKGLAPLYFKLSDPLAQAIEGCANGGTVDVTLTVQNPNVPTVGDRIVAVFDNCDDNLGYVISGTADLTLADLQGDVATDVFLVSFDILLTDIAVTEGMETVTADGSFTLTIDSLDFPSVTMSLVGTELQFGADGDVVTMTDFDHTLTVDAGVVPDAKLAEAFGRLDSQTLGGTVDYATSTAIQASGDIDPHTGVIVITGADGSSVRIVIVDSTSVTLEIDANGDDVIDEYIDTSWAELNKEAPVVGTGLITSENVPIIAREVFNAVTGFGSVTVAAGGQFTPTGVFGQIKQQAMSGDFGPFSVACITSGGASVSGAISAAGAFSANDQLNADFIGCTRDNEGLEGEMNVAVSSFTETSGDAYLVTGTVAQDDLLRFIDGSCHAGTGTFNTSYDFVFSTTGLVDMDSSASEFSVWSGGRSQTLNGATVNAQIMVGQQPVTVTRTSSGTVTSEDLDGSFGYVSVSPDVFLIDGDAATGPYSGELLVSGRDNSSIRMVALDERNLRLDIDFDGNSTVDEQAMTTWATLGYGDSFGICSMRF